MERAAYRALLLIGYLPKEHSPSTTKINGVIKLSTKNGRKHCASGRSTQPNPTLFPEPNWENILLSRIRDPIEHRRIGLGDTDVCGRDLIGAGHHHPAVRPQARAQRVGLHLQMPTEMIRRPGQRQGAARYRERDWHWGGVDRGIDTDRTVHGQVIVPRQTGTRGRG